MITHTMKRATLLFALALPFSALAHDHGHNHDHKAIHEGKFENNEVRDRALSDWQGDWQSIYPLLQNGSLDEVFEHKAAVKKDKSAAQYKTYYQQGYASDVSTIVITASSMRFTQQGQTHTGTYAYSGFKILTYPSGNKGVRYLFTRTAGDAKAPKFVQFSDHDIEPTKAHHFHIFFGDSSHETLEKELVNWPTFFPTGKSGEEIAAELMLE